MRDGRPTLDPEIAGRFVRLALECVGREYPNHPLTLLTGDGDVRPPRFHTPAFFGCFDWHSAVHAHWTLTRLARLFPDADWSDDARNTLRRSLTTGNIAAEVRHLLKPGREGFERPYGLAWLLQLAAELREWDDPDATGHAAALAPLERLCRDRLADWLPKLTHPIRSGEHSQTAFAMGLALDWCRTSGDGAFSAVLRDRTLAFHLDDADLPLRFEPSGHDFLSPSLAVADVMRRVMTPERFAGWLMQAVPCVFEESSRGVATPRLPCAFLPVRSADRSDGKLAHLDGLNLSRAWMLDGIAAGLPDSDPWRLTLLELADAHAAAGLAAVTGEHYAGGHWLGTFAAYLLTRRGIA